MREDGRECDALRKVKITRGVAKFAEGSALIEVGDTKVMCTASVEDKVPQFLLGSGRGWVTAEYGMLPRATGERTVREATRGRVGGRTHEIQRLIGRSMRSVVDLRALRGKTIWLDCDVLQADGGTRTAAITGGFVALVACLARMKRALLIERWPVLDFVAAASIGIVKGEPMVDLTYDEDSGADVDMNVVMTGSGRFIELQGTAEGKPFERSDLDALLALASGAVTRLVAEQKKVLQDVKEMTAAGQSGAGKK